VLLYAPKQGNSACLVTKRFSLNKIEMTRFSFLFFLFVFLCVWQNVMI